jgi:hypothetical protein
MFSSGTLSASQKTQWEDATCAMTPPRKASLKSLEALEALPISYGKTDIWIEI